MRLTDKGPGGTVEHRDLGEEIEGLKASAKALTGGILDAARNASAQRLSTSAAFLGRTIPVPQEGPSETREAMNILSEVLRGLGVQGSLATHFASALEALVEAESTSPPRTAKRDETPRPLIFGFGGEATGPLPESAAERKKLLGGKGAELLEMSALGMPIPPGLTLTTEACARYLETKRMPDGAEQQLDEGLRRLEAQLGKKLGNPENPLLVSVRSGAAVSMPGMMDTILNLGLNDQVCVGLARKTGNERFAYDAYRRFISMFGNVAMGVDHRCFEEALEALKKKKGVKLDVELTADDLKLLVKRYLTIYKRETGEKFPSDPKEQLRRAVRAVFDSWNNDRAIKYREINKIDGLVGTGVNVQAMVFGNMGDESGTGVCFTRNPGTGSRELFGEFLTNAQGEDVVAGIRTPMPISQMAEKFPEAYEQLVALCHRLEAHYGNMQDIEFTVENNKLFILQTRSGKRNGEAAVKIAVDLVREGVTDPESAVLRMVSPEHVEQMLRPRFAETDGVASVKLAKGIAASPGAAVGRAVFTVEDAITLAKQGTPVILVRNDTSPEDVGGMDAAQGVLTRTGGKTSHAAVVARGWGKPCVTGCGDLEVDEKGRRFTTAEGVAIEHGDWISLNGSTGEVVLGKRKLVQPEPNGDLATLMGWVDELRTTEVRVNAESLAEVERALAFGADGIGLCRTDHMFFQGKNLGHTQAMILSDSAGERRDALAKEHAAWKEEFKTIFRIDGRQAGHDPPAVRLDGQVPAGERPAPREGRGRGRRAPRDREGEEGRAEGDRPHARAQGVSSGVPVPRDHRSPDEGDHRGRPRAPAGGHTSEARDHGPDGRLGGRAPSPEEDHRAGGGGRLCSAGRDHRLRHRRHHRDAPRRARRR